MAQQGVPIARPGFSNVSPRMNVNSEPIDNESDPVQPLAWRPRIAIATIAVTAIAITTVIVLLLGSTQAGKPSEVIKYHVGSPDVREPSGLAPPTAKAIPGYTLTYVQDFLGTSIPQGWYVFTGIPGGDPGGQFGRSHVVVSRGLLRLNAWKDPQYQNKWVTGGLCNCGHVQTYGLYLVRSRLTGAGPNEAQLLWPASDVWPPEIDFNETGGTDQSTSSTVHFGKTNLIDQRSFRINMKVWHTWGVEWTPTAIDYLVDGRVWGSVTNVNEIPNVPMRLDIEQRTKCQVGIECPKAPVSMLVDWVAQFSPNK